MDDVMGDKDAAPAFGARGEHSARHRLAVIAHQPQRRAPIDAPNDGNHAAPRRAVCYAGDTVTEMRQALHAFGCDENSTGTRFKAADGAPGDQAIFHNDASLAEAFRAELDLSISLRPDELVGDMLLRAPRWRQVVARIYQSPEFSPRREYPEEIAAPDRHTLHEIYMIARVACARMGAPQGLCCDAAQTVATMESWGFGGLDAVADEVDEIGHAPPEASGDNMHITIVGGDGRGGRLLQAHGASAALWGATLSDVAAGFARRHGVSRLIVRGLEHPGFLAAALTRPPQGGATRAHWRGPNGEAGAVADVGGVTIYGDADGLAIDLVEEVVIEAGAHAQSAPSAPVFARQNTLANAVKSARRNGVALDADIRARLVRDA